MGGNTSFEPFGVIISATVRPGDRIEKKNSITKKVTQVLYFRYLGGSPRWADSTLKLHGVCDVGDVITCAKFQIEIFMGYNFTGGRIFDFPIDFSMGLTTAQRYCAACDYGLPYSIWQAVL